MNPHNIWVAVLSVMLVAAEAKAADTDVNPAGKAEAPAVQKPAKNVEGWPVLKAGITSEEVIKLVGRPNEVRPMASKEGKAEVWVYRRLAKHLTRQTAATTTDIQTYGMDGTSTIAVPVMKMEHINVYQVSSLLMFDGKLVTASQKAETERHFE